MPLHPAIAAVTDRIRARSETLRGEYLDRMGRAAAAGPVRAHLSCGNQAHAYAAMGPDKDALAAGRTPNIGIVTAYNDMLSAHQPFESYPALIRAPPRAAGRYRAGRRRRARHVRWRDPGPAGMELSLFSRDVIALAAGVALSHNCFDAALYLGVCDKIVPASSSPPPPSATSPASSSPPGR